MILDWHSHIYTPEEAADDLRTWDGNTGPSWGERGCPMVLENFVRAHEENNIDISVVTNAAHYLKGKRDSEELPSARSGSSASKASSSIRATRAIIPTTTKRARSGSWCRTSTCR